VVCVCAWVSTLNVVWCANELNYTLHPKRGVVRYEQLLNYSTNP